MQTTLQTPAPTPFDKLPKRRKLSLTYTCTVTDIPSVGKELSVWVPLLSSNDRQSVKHTTPLAPLQGWTRTQDKKFGNRLLHRSVMSPATELSQGTLTITLTYEVELVEQTVLAAKAQPLPSTTRSLPRQAYQPYLGELAFVPLSGPITNLASKMALPKGEPLRAGRKIYDYLIDTMVYNHKAPGAGKGDAVWACDSKTGNCADYHSVFIGVCRSQGIPADHVFGLPLNPDQASGTIASYHCWARFWVEGIGWVPIDASEADKHPDQRDYLFGSLCTRCIEITHGRDLVLEPAQKAGPLNVFYFPYAELDGKPFTNVQWSCDFVETQR